MNPKPLLIRNLNKLIFVVFSLLVLFTVSLQASDRSLAAESSFMKEYGITGKALNIVVEAPGRLWFTLPESNAIGSLVVTSTVDFKFTSFPLPTPNSQPYDLVYDATREVVWFTELTGNRIGQLDPTTGVVQQYNIPTDNPAPTGITLDGQGIIWFAQRQGNNLGKFDPTTQTFTEYAIPIANAQPEDVAVQRSGWVCTEGCIWITGPNINQMFLFRVETEEMENLPTISQLGQGTEPWNVIVDSANSVWITTRTGSLIGKFLGGTQVDWIWYATSSANAKPTGIASHTTSGRVHIWFTENQTGRATYMQNVNINFASSVPVRGHPLPSPSSRPAGIAVDTQGTVWITDQAHDVIVSWRSPYFYFLQLPIIRKGQ